MTEQELRDEFEEWANKVNVSKYNEVYFVIFKSGYMIAQETIKAKDSEINKWYREWYNEHTKSQKAIAEARELINKLLDRAEIDNDYDDYEKAKEWLESNK